MVHAVTGPADAAYVCLDFTLMIDVDDLKVAECFIGMHNYAAYQGEGSGSSGGSSQGTRMAKIAKLCEGLEASLEFRNEVVERMALLNIRHQLDYTLTRNFCKVANINDYWRCRGYR